MIAFASSWEAVGSVLQAICVVSHEEHFSANELS